MNKVTVIDDGIYLRLPLLSVKSSNGTALCFRPEDYCGEHQCHFSTSARISGENSISS